MDQPSFVTYAVKDLRNLGCKPASYYDSAQSSEQRFWNYFIATQQKFHVKSVLTYELTDFDLTTGEIPFIIRILSELGYASKLIVTDWIDLGAKVIDPDHSFSDRESRFDPVYTLCVGITQDDLTNYTTKQVVLDKPES